ncbi:hypothetical protein BJY52DRAFT_1185469 [Lactarius psammicola]|nr:hypothetical protein BJY52DRAFT_1185469 [Lactarius psammicola]
MCSLHHVFFDSYYFFLRYVSSTERYVFVNYSGVRELQDFHGKAFAFDNRDRLAPLPSLFVIHKMHVRRFHPFTPVSPDVPDSPFQERSSPPDNGNSSIITQRLPQFPPTTTNAGGGASSGIYALELNADVIVEIVAATRAMPLWMACEEEGTSWTGIAEENTQKYVSSIDVEHR